MSAANEFTPLVQPKRKGARLNSVDDDPSPIRRTISLLNRARSRRQHNMEKPTGIEGVLKELEDGERRDSRFIFIALLGFVFHILSGAFILSLLEGWDFYDAVYFCVVTTTTVGYGDLTPKHPLARLYIVLYVIVSLALISTILATLIGQLLDQQEEILMAALVGEEDPDVPDMSADDSQGNITEQIMNATRSLDLGDYFGLAFSSMWFVVILICGMSIFMIVEKLDVLDALYTTIISASTVGFGDFKPTQEVSKVLISIWLVFATTCAVKVIADFTDASVKAKQRAVSRRLLTAQMDLGSLRAMDRDGNQSVDKAEFITEMLIRTGKVDRSEIDLMLMRFSQLDKTKSGEVSLEEVLAD